MPPFVKRELSPSLRYRGTYLAWLWFPDLREKRLWYSNTDKSLVWDLMGHLFSVENRHLTFLDTAVALTVDLVDRRSRIVVMTKVTGERKNSIRSRTAGRRPKKYLWGT